MPSFFNIFDVFVGYVYVVDSVFKVILDYFRENREY